MDVLNQSGTVASALQMIDSTVIRAHYQAAGAKGEFHERALAVLEPRRVFRRLIVVIYAAMFSVSRAA